PIARCPAVAGVCRCRRAVAELARVPPEQPEVWRLRPRRTPRLARRLTLLDTSDDSHYTPPRCGWVPPSRKKIRSTGNGGPCAPARSPLLSIARSRHLLSTRQPKRGDMESPAHYWTDRPVCVTGGTGFLGYHLVRRLVDHRARVRVL